MAYIDLEGEALESRVEMLLGDFASWHPAIAEIEREQEKIITHPALRDMVKRQCEALGFVEGRSWETLPEIEKHFLAKAICIQNIRGWNTNAGKYLQREIGSAESFLPADAALEKLREDFLQAEKKKEDCYRRLEKFCFDPFTEKKLTKERVAFFCKGSRLPEDYRAVVLKYATEKGWLSPIPTVTGDEKTHDGGVTHPGQLHHNAFGI